MQEKRVFQCLAPCKNFIVPSELILEEVDAVMNSTIVILWRVELNMSYVSWIASWRRIQNSSVSSRQRVNESGVEGFYKVQLMTNTLLKINTPDIEHNNRKASECKPHFQIYRDVWTDQVFRNVIVKSMRQILS